MRSLLAVVALLCACAPATAPCPAPPAPPAVVAAPSVLPVPSPPPPSPASILERSHDILAAMDRADVAAVSAILAPDYVHFEGDYVDRDHELATLRDRGPTAPHIGTRTWSHERVSVRASDAVVVGEALEHTAGNESHGGYNYDGWYTLAWSRDGDAWKLVFLGWRQGGPGGKRASWDEIFRNSIGFSHEPNRLLVDTVAHTRPGAALDVAMGQGRNALYLAAHGWRVTGVDISDEGIAQARAAAVQRKVALDAVDMDIDRYDFGRNKWDLVTMIYATDNAAWMEKIKPSLRKGGLFVLEYFALDPANGQDDGIPPGKLAKMFGEGFEIVRDEVVDDVPDWAMDRAKLARFVARKK
jgi:SAM-dependent methyltransferase